MFIDEARIHIKAGDGGAGVIAFRREKYVPFGGPAGGDGGKGGDVVLVVNPNLNTLSRFQRRHQFQAQRGSNGGNFNRTGASASDLELEVAPGTIVKDLAGTIIADLSLAGQRATIANGGRGGRGNARCKSATNQAQRVAEKGEPGEDRWLTLELRLIADVGIVGAPNAGKSTLLSVLSDAKPRIENYPFTTLVPNLGVARFGDREIVFADIPGLVEGAHDGVGLGHSFLRHIQRTRLLLHLLDAAEPDPLGDLKHINAELALYDPDLAIKPQIVVLNKIDLEDARNKSPNLRERIQKLGYTAVAISAATHSGLEELLAIVVQNLANLPDLQPAKYTAIYRPEFDDGFEVVREGVAFRVIGHRIERTAAMTYWNYDEAIDRFQRMLNSQGIADALRNAGAKRGDIVRIGDHELDWVE